MRTLAGRRVQQDADEAARQKQVADIKAAQRLQKELKRQEHAAAAKIALLNQKIVQKKRQRAYDKIEHEAHEANDKAESDQAATETNQAKELQDAARNRNQKLANRAKHEADVVKAKWKREEEEKQARTAQMVAEKEKAASGKAVSHARAAERKVSQETPQKSRLSTFERPKGHAAAKPCRHTQTTTEGATLPTGEDYKDDPRYSISARMAVIQEQKKARIAAREAEEAAKEAARQERLRIGALSDGDALNEIARHKATFLADPKVLGNKRVRATMIFEEALMVDAPQAMQANIKVAVVLKKTISMLDDLMKSKPQIDQDYIHDAKSSSGKKERPKGAEDVDLGQEAGNHHRTTPFLTTPTTLNRPLRQTKPQQRSTPAPARPSVRNKKRVKYEEDSMDIDSFEDMSSPAAGASQPARTAAIHARKGNSTWVPVPVGEAKKGRNPAQPRIGRGEGRPLRSSMSESQKSQKKDNIALGKRKRTEYLNIAYTTPSGKATITREPRPSLIVKLKVAAAQLDRLTASPETNENHPQDSLSTQPKPAKRQKTTQTTATKSIKPTVETSHRNTSPPAPVTDPGIDVETLDSDDNDSAWEDASTTSSQPLSSFGTLYEEVPLPFLKPRDRGPFQQGFIIALENIAEDHVAHPDLTILEVIEYLEDNRPTAHREDWTTKATLKGGTFAYDQVKAMESGLNAGLTGKNKLTTVEMCLCVGGKVKKEWMDKGWADSDWGVLDESDEE